MSVRIVDTYPDIEKCFTGSGFSKDLWNDYIDHYLPYAKELIEQDCSEYDFDEQVLPVLNAVCKNRDALALSHDSFIATVSDVESRIREEFDADIDVVVAFYLGLCNGAGWVTVLNGVPHVLLGVEKIIELNWCGERDMKGLIFHELGHVLHDLKRSIAQEIATQRDNALWQLYSEGIAMYCEQRLCDDEDFYHQDVDGWLDWCSANRAALFGEYIRVIESNESHQKFFGDWCNYLGVSDIGYYLGCELIKRLVR